LSACSVCRSLRVISFSSLRYSQNDIESACYGRVSSREKFERKSTREGRKRPVLRLEEVQVHTCVHVWAVRSCRRAQADAESRFQAGHCLVGFLTKERACTDGSLHIGSYSLSKAPYTSRTRRRSPSCPPHQKKPLFFTSPPNSIKLQNVLG
jgi:hypothetical protein